MENTPGTAHMVSVYSRTSAAQGELGGARSIRARAKGAQMAHVVGMQPASAQEFRTNVASAGWERTALPPHKLRKLPRATPCWPAFDEA